MLTESGYIIRYVFLLLAGLRPFKLEVGGGGEPVIFSWDFVRFGVGRAVMSLDQSPLATSCGVCMSGWTVCYRGDKSRDGGIAISLVGGQVGLHRSGLTMNVTLSAYLLSLRLSGVLQ